MSQYFTYKTGLLISSAKKTEGVQELKMKLFE